MTFVFVVDGEFQHGLLVRRDTVDFVAGNIIRVRDVTVMITEVAERFIPEMLDRETGRPRLLMRVTTKTI